MKIDRRVCQNIYCNGGGNISIEFDIKYGLIVLSATELKNGIYNILHFTGFESEPGDDDKKHIKEESLYNTEFNLSEYYDEDDILVIDADDATVAKYRDILTDLINEE